ncbi:protein scaf8 [Anaeramoeba flamelloides]|uniref:Protein scaf8 n=1 Tax=Anaeramoeba flamelloides TaxID=1746091 RepID=A0AAV7YQ66_9EUKA|nr:protein scaf8 [Anaeramoeba flamelloides]
MDLFDWEGSDWLLEQLDRVDYLKPSKKSIDNIAKYIIKNENYYKFSVKLIEKFLTKAIKERYLIILYVIDSVVKHAQSRKSKRDRFTARFEINLEKTLKTILTYQEKMRSIIKVIILWKKNRVFKEEIVNKILEFSLTKGAREHFSEFQFEESSIYTIRSNEDQINHHENKKQTKGSFQGFVSVVQESTASQQTQPLENKDNVNYKNGEFLNNKSFNLESKNKNFIDKEKEKERERERGREREKGGGKGRGRESGRERERKREREGEKHNKNQDYSHEKKGESAILRKRDSKSREKDSSTKIRRTSENNVTTLGEEDENSLTDKNKKEEKRKSHSHRSHKSKRSHRSSRSHRSRDSKKDGERDERDDKHHRHHRKHHRHHRRHRHSSGSRSKRGSKNRDEVNQTKEESSKTHKNEENDLELDEQALTLKKTISVFDIPKSIDSESLLSYLRKCGEITDHYIKLDENMAFFTFQKVKEAEDAIHKGKKYPLKGENLTIISSYNNNSNTTKNDYDDNQNKNNFEQSTSLNDRWDDY